MFLRRNRPDGKQDNSNYMKRLKIFRQVVNHVPPGFKIIGYSTGDGYCIPCQEIPRLQEHVCEDGHQLVFAADLDKCGG